MTVLHCNLIITEQPYNEGLIHRKYKQWEPIPVGFYKQMSAMKEGVIMRLQCIQFCWSIKLGRGSGGRGSLEAVP